MDGTYSFPTEEVNLEAWDAHETSPELVEMTLLKFYSPEPQTVQHQPPGTGKCMHAGDHHGKSDWTMRRHKKAKRDLEEKGFVSLQEFFKQKAMRVAQHNSDECRQAPNQAPDAMSEANMAGSAHCAVGSTAPVHVFEEE